MIADKRSGKIVATAFCEGKTHDFTLFKRSKTALSVSLAALTDSGYQGINKLHANSESPKKKSKKHPLTDEEKAANRDISSRRIGCEHVIGRLKVFRIFSERYRNRRKRFGLRFNLIAAICNMERDE